ncbi:SOS response-associated peptidase family protein [Leucobacter sp. W1153]|uniref:SOS response-associated peptidase family protein n=2 Tax=Leucobacter sp. W1153 TaxID=3439064 RepID=UPI003F2DADC5
MFGRRAMLVMAGLHSWWRSPASAPGEGWQLTATILTRASAGAMTPLHDRMPVLLGTALLADWLDPALEGDQLLVNAVSEASVQLAKDLQTYAVHPLRGDGPDLILPI